MLESMKTPMLSRESSDRRGSGESDLTRTSQHRQHGLLAGSPYKVELGRHQIMDSEHE